MKKIHVPAIFRNEQVNQVLMAIFGAIMVGLVYLYWSGLDRKALDFAGVEMDISMAQREIANLNSASQLPDIYDQWQAALSIANSFQVKLVPLQEGSPASINPDLSGGGHLWQGTLEGAPSNVLLTAIYIQNRLPSAMGDLAIDSGKAVMVFGVIGSPPIKMNIDKN